MRLYLLPISTRRTLLYAQRLNHQLTSKKSLIERVIARANKQWVSWEAAEKGWQKKVTDWGNSAFARIPYQEWGLKSVPPLSARRKEAEDKVDVLYPRGVMREEQVTQVLRQLATERKGLHRKWMWWSIAGMPASAPFALVPIVPNLPFFYLAFRAWSHWRALSGSEHIEYLLEKGLLRPSASTPLHEAYEIRTITPDQMEGLKKINAEEGLGEEQRMAQVMETIASPHKQELPEPLPEDGPEEILLEKRSGKLVARVLKLPGLDIEIERAVDQISRMMAKEAQEKEAQAKEARAKAAESRPPADDHEKKQ